MNSAPQLAFIQERQAEVAVDAPEVSLPPHATMIRDGREQQLEATLPIFGTAALGVAALPFVSPFPLIVLGADELRRCWHRRKAA